MKLLHIAPLLLLTLSFSHPILAQDDEATDRTCKQLEQLPFPKEMATIKAPTKWPSCASYKFYAGIGTKIDDQAAMQCALLERAAHDAGLSPEGPIPEVMGGANLLVMLYANGEGVAQDKQLARKFACETSHPKSILKAIETLPDSTLAKKEKLDYCHDFAFTTIEMNYCALYDSEIEEERRNRQLQQLERNWSKEQLDAFKALVKAKNDYIDIHGRNEVYRGGTIRGIRIWSIKETMQGRFLGGIQAFEHGQLPKGDERSFQRADAELNRLYQKIINVAQSYHGDDNGLHSSEEIRDAEKAWLVYKDAWIKFAALRYPSAGRYGFLILLTRNRANVLRMMLCDFEEGRSACTTESNL